MPDEKTLVAQWNQKALDAISCTRTSPPPAARALAMLHTAMYDAWSVYNECAISTTTALYIKRPAVECSKENKRKAFSHAAYRVLTDLFWAVLPPEGKYMFRDFMCELGCDPNNTSLDITKPEGIGNLAARMTLEYRYGDGANQLGTLHETCYSDYTRYKPANTPDQLKEPGKWQPLKVPDGAGGFKIQNYLVPQWGLVKPFALDPTPIFRPPAPHAFGSVSFQKQVDEILQISAGLTDEMKMIAEYWEDGPGTVTPPGHWCLIAQFVSNRDKHRNSQDIKMFFALCNALLDCSIACWEGKRFYEYGRPVSVIRHLYKGKIIKAWGGPKQGTKDIKGEEWLPYQRLNFVTPPFPEYTSGHSTFSSAAATVLQSFTGSDVFVAGKTLGQGSSTIEPGYTPAQNVSLRWKTFSEAAKQAGMSRLYGGIHFAQGNIEGQELGRKIGNRAWQKSIYYFNES